MLTLSLLIVVVWLSVILHIIIYYLWKHRNKIVAISCYRCKESGLEKDGDTCRICDGKGLIIFKTRSSRRHLRKCYGRDLCWIR